VGTSSTPGPQEKGLAAYLEGLAQAAGHAHRIDMLIAPQFLDLLPQLLLLAQQLADQADQFGSIQGVQIRHETLSPDLVCNARAIKSRYSRTASAFR
jgi:hypothetical protein